MSALGPWRMTWGKLLGSTRFVWYGAAICAVGYLFAERWSPEWLDHLEGVLVAAMAQPAALLVALVLVRAGAPRPRVDSAVAIGGGIAVAGPPSCWRESWRKDSAPGSRSHRRRSKYCTTRCSP
ncbi:MAG: hypothetical protein FJX53_06295, partial [Alphaproteobacteria bacterium]|nr:hypothetical protein [Alphaproteobacteria bacterium]